MRLIKSDYPLGMGSDAVIHSSHKQERTQSSMNSIISLSYSRHVASIFIKNCESGAQQLMNK
jgi:flagellar biosynthesis regulator FlaF